MTRLMWLVAMLPIVVASDAQDVDYSQQLPRIAPTEPADALSTFSVAEGFEIQTVAAEPLVSSPVAIEWDADGGMYVCEMRGYSENRDDRLSSIARLTDEDGDGIYDRRTTLVDGLNWPTGLFPFDGGLFVGDAPDLLYVKDTDGDGAADITKRVLTGFGTSNVQGLMNSFRWGLDNRIHIACSSSGGEIVRVDAPDAEPISIRGRDIAFDPRTGTFELTSGAAQHGMCFDDWGYKFVSSNSDHIQQVMYEDRYVARNPFFSPPPSRISIAADGPQAEVFRTSPVEPWRILRTELRVSGKASGPIEGGGRAAGYFTGATGVTIYRGDAWPSEWKGIAVVGDVGGNLIHRKRLDVNGIERIARRIDQQREFVSSTDVWFRPAQFANAPDGSLHVVDVYREVIEHPLSLPPEIKRHLDLTAGRDRGRIYRIVAKNSTARPTPSVADLSTEELVATLAHPNAWHRETAARLLFERRDEGAIEPLRQLASQSTSPLARMHALYSLQGLEALDEPTLLLRLSDEHPEVRRHAVQLAEQLAFTVSLAKRLTAMSDDDALPVRIQLAFTVGSFPLSDRTEVLARLIRSDVSDRWMQTAVLSSLAEDAAPLLVALVKDDAFRSSAAQSFLQQLLRLIVSQNRERDLRLAVTAISEMTAQAPVFSLRLYRELDPDRQRRDSRLHQLATSNELTKLKQAAVDWVDRAIRVAGDSMAAVEQRVAAVEAIAVADWLVVAPHLQALLQSHQPHAVQRTAIRVIGTYEDAAATRLLLDHWSQFSPSLRTAAEEAIGSRAESTLAMFDAIGAGLIRRSDLGLARLQQWQKSQHHEVRERASRLLESRPAGRRGDLVAEYQPALNLPADVQRGRKLFQKHCSGCHRVEGVGYEIGPPLGTIQTRGAETILAAVLDPNREVNPQYLNYIASTLDGRIVSGMIADEGASSITLRRGEKAEDTLLRIDIDVVQSTGQSIMPEGFEETLDHQAMADLIGYLMQAQ